MSGFNPNSAWAGEAVLSLSEINAELGALEGTNDPQSNARRSGLIDDLPCADMNLKPMRKAMVGTEDPKQPESTEERQP